MSQKRLVIFGFGGHARSVADVAISCGYSDLLFVDANARPGEHFLGHSVINSLSGQALDGCAAFPASGDNQKRSQQCAEIRSLGLDLVALISPLASLGIGSVVAAGSFIGHHAHVGPMARIGAGCIINTAAIVEHESEVGDYSHVSVNSVIAGRSRLGMFSMLGASATIIDGVDVRDNIIIGAGAVVHRSIATPGTYVGIPAAKLR